MTKILVDKSLLEQAIDTLGYYASVCGEDDQDTPAKQTQSVLREALAEPAAGFFLSSTPNQKGKS